MATPFVISCPECEKQIKVNSDLIGKKLRCKSCQTVFPVQSPEIPEKEKKNSKAPVKAEKNAKQESGEKSANPPESANPANLSDSPQARIRAELEEEDAQGSNPYGLSNEYNDTSARCPRCAAEMPNDKAVICMECGYNTRTRLKHETMVTNEQTSSDIFLWRLPAIIAILASIALIAVSILAWLKMAPSIDKAIAEDEDLKVIPPGSCFALWVNVICLTITYFLSRFSYRRLVLNSRPAEVDITKE